MPNIDAHPVGHAPLCPTYKNANYDSAKYNLTKQESGDSIPWRESFSRHFQNDTVAGICLNSARAAKGLTQAQLAELAEIPQRHISEMERSKRGIGKDRALRLAKALDTDYRLFL